jgi:hypothetical protein
MSSVDIADQFFIMALAKGELPAEQEEDMISHTVLRARATHALMPERSDLARQVLDIWGEKPDDDAIYELFAKWHSELNEARLISFEKRGRRPKSEMAWLKYRLYLVAAEENPATVRGIYYRAVSRGYVPKSDSAYDLVQRTLLSMRREGWLPWHWVTDSSRRVWGSMRFGDMESYARHIAANYRKDYWLESPVNVEVWCEKDAMQGVIAPVVIEEFGLNLYVSKGQSSASYLYEAAAGIREDGRPTTVYILSDFDPAGFRIADKIESGLREHIGNELVLSAERIAVSHEQVLRYGLPTRRVKKTDSGAADFLRQYGDVSCELEAMPPNTLRRLIAEHLEEHMDQDRLQTLKLAEQEEQRGLRDIQDLLGGAA